jgi:methylene-tetrahydromethanopterin dehydrogenase
MTAPRILHFLTPLPNVSPFDVNMAVDAGFVVASYTGIGLGDITGLTHDAMFSRAPQDAPKTVLFIGGRDAALALDMAAAAKAAMFPPFLISVFADPSGAFTTAASMVRCVERALRLQDDTLVGKRTAVFGAKGVVGGIAGVIAAEAGAAVTLVAHDASGVVPKKAAEFSQRFACRLAVADGSTPDGRAAVLAESDLALCCGKAGVQILSQADLEHGTALRVVADLNAVPPAGVDGLSAKANGAPLPGTRAVGIGAFAIGHTKIQLQHSILAILHDVDEAMHVDFRDAYRLADDGIR